MQLDKKLKIVLVQNWFQVHSLLKLKLKFISAGILNTIFGYSFYVILIYLELTPSYALFFSTIAGIIFNYISFKSFVFKKTNSMTRLVKYFSSYTLVYLFNITILYLVNTYITMNLYVAQLICIPFTVFISWVLMNKWVFK